MEKRIGIIAIIVSDKSSVPKLNTLLSSYSEIIIGRLGLPLRERKIHLLSIIVDGTNDQIGALSGKIGRLEGITVKSLLTPESV